MKIKRLLLVAGASAVLAVVAAVGLADRQPSITRGPYLQQSSPNRMVIRWLTDRPVQTFVRYGRTPEQLEYREETHMNGIDHAVLLSDLWPGTEYWYEVGSARGNLGRPGQIHRLVTPPETGSPSAVRVWVLGDSGTREHAQAAVRDAFNDFSGGHPPDVWLMLGDNAYRKGTETEYQKAVFDFYPDLLSRLALWPTLGNHDARSADPATQTGVYFDLFNLPSQGQCGGVASGTEAYYAFNHANLHFICLDSEGSDRSPDGPMLTWLKQDLAQNQQPWTVAFWHQPPYTKGSHDSDHGLQMQEMREHALPILEAAGVDLVLGGHSHTYERSYLLDGHYGKSDSFSETMIKNRSDGRSDGAGPYVKLAGVQPHGGTVYIVAGSSGHASRLAAKPHPAMCVSLNVAGSLVLDVEGPQLEAKFLDEAGQIRDQFVILKRTPGAG